MFQSALSNVPTSVATILSYTILAVVAIFLIFGPAIVYYYRRKAKRMNAASSTGPA
jgi:cbb3-type cytochrome oxidase subunit 3